jgi:hypothetical protein
MESHSERKAIQNERMPNTEWTPCWLYGWLVAWLAGWMAGGLDGWLSDMLSDPFNSTLRESLAPKGVAKPFDPSSGLLIPQRVWVKDFSTTETQNLFDFGFKQPLTRPTINPKN